MNKTNTLADRLMLGLGTGILVVSTGCIVPVDGGYSGDVVVPGPPGVVVFDGGFDRRRDAHAYSERGFASRAVAHPVHAAAPHGGGGEARRR